jgi:hypothetical protein
MYLYKNDVENFLKVLPTRIRVLNQLNFAAAMGRLVYGRVISMIRSATHLTCARPDSCQ